MAHGVSAKQSGYDVYQFKTFARKDIQVKDAEKRLEFLRLLREGLSLGREEALSENQKEFDQKEFTNLEVALKPSGNQSFSRVKILKSGIGEFYFVKFFDSPKEALLRRFNEARSVIISTNMALGEEEKSAVLEKAIQMKDAGSSPHAEDSLMKMNEVLCAIFSEDVEDALLKILELCQQGIKQRGASGILQEQFSNLGQLRLQFCRACQSSLLKQVKVIQNSAMKVCNLLEECGPTLDKVPERFWEICSQSVGEEEGHVLKMFEEITRHLKLLLSGVTCLGDEVQRLSHSLQPTVCIEELPQLPRQKKEPPSSVASIKLPKGNPSTEVEFSSPENPISQVWSLLKQACKTFFTQHRNADMIPPHDGRSHGAPSSPLDKVLDLLAKLKEGVEKVERLSHSRILAIQEQLQSKEAFDVEKAVNYLWVYGEKLLGLQAIFSKLERQYGAMHRTHDVENQWDTLTAEENSSGPVEKMEIIEEQATRVEIIKADEETHDGEQHDRHPSVKDPEGRGQPEMADQTTVSSSLEGENGQLTPLQSLTTEAIEEKKRKTIPDKSDGG